MKLQWEKVCCRAGEGIVKIREACAFESLLTHYAGATANADVTPHCIQIFVRDGADVISGGREGGQIIACEGVIVVGHGVGEAADYSFGDVWMSKLAEKDISGQNGGRTFVLWLRGARIACDEVLVVVWSQWIEVHRSGNVQ